MGCPGNDGIMYFHYDILKTIFPIPVRVVCFEFSYVADPPYMITDPVIVGISIIHFVAADSLA